MVGVNEPNTQVGYVSLLMKLLSNKDTLDKILEAKTKKAIYKILTKKEK